MSKIQKMLRRLGKNEAELREFLRDDSAWIERTSASLSSKQREELERVAMDLHRFMEMRCREQLDESGESRFCDGKGIGRRRFMLNAASVALAVPFAGVYMSPPAAASRAGSAFVRVATDNGCENTSGCSDDEACSDKNCANSSIGGCNDEDSCVDHQDCTNGVGSCDDGNQCNDSNDCTNNRRCTDDDHCTDTNNCENNGGLGCGDDSNCTDSSACTNLDTCNDTNTCFDNSCTNSMTCVDSKCTDTSCTNSGTCTDSASCLP